MKRNKIGEYKAVITVLIFCLAISVVTRGQVPVSKTFTHADTLRGSITPERIWWDVLKYDITVKPDFTSKTTVGKNTITYKILSDAHPAVMQIDLQQPLQIDTVLVNSSVKAPFKQEGNAWFVQLPD